MQCEGNIPIASMSRILELKKNPPVDILVDLPKLPVDYASLYKCGNQGKMLSFANQLLHAYIDPTAIGTGKINFYPKTSTNHFSVKLISLPFTI